MANINRTISIQAEDAGATQSIDRLRETGGRMYDDIRRRAEQYTKELEQQADKVQKLIDKEKELQRVAGGGGDGGGGTTGGGNVAGGRGTSRWARRPKWTGGQGSQGQGQGGEGEQTSSDDEEEENEKSKGNPTATFLAGIGLFGIGTLMSKAVEQGKEELRAGARLKPMKSGFDGKGIDFDSGGGYTALGINQASRYRLEQQAGQAGGKGGVADLSSRLKMERGLGLDQGALQGMEEMGFAGSRGSERGIELMQKMFASGIWDIGKTDIMTIGKGIQNMVALNKVEYGLFADFTGKGSSSAMATVGQAGGMFNDPNRQMGLMMGMHQDMTQGGNPFIDAIINESLIRANPDLAMSPIGMTKLRAKRARGIFEEGNLEAVLATIQDFAGGDSDRATALGANVFGSLMPYVGTDDMTGELANFFMGTGGKKGKQQSIENIKQMMNAKSNQGGAEFESLGTQMENQMADIGISIRGGLDSFTKGTLAVMEFTAGEIKKTMEGWMMIADALKKLLK